MFLDASIFLEIINSGDLSPLYVERIKNSHRKCNTSAAVRLDVVTRLAQVRSEGRPMTSEDMAIATEVFERVRSVLDVYEITVSPRIANDACALYASFGEQSGHKASLMMADCLSLAAGESLRTRVMSAREGFTHITDEVMAAWHKAR